MAISGIIFDNQVPTAKGLRGGFKSALSDGILSGCAIDISSGLNFKIGPGLMIVSGGIFQLVGNPAATIAIASNNNTYARIKAKIDLSQGTSPFEQVSFNVDYANSATGFAALTQQDINTGTGTIYEAEICVVRKTSSAITGIVRTANASPKIQYGDSLPSDAPEGTIFLLKVT